MTTLEMQRAAARREEPAVAARSFYGEAWERLRADRSALAAVLVLALIVGSAILAPLITAYSPTTGDVAMRLEPIGTPGHILGTDDQGRDMLTRLLYGGRVSLLTGIVPVLIAAVLGTAIGTLAGYLGGAAGGTMMRVMDVSYAFPAVLLAIAITAALGPGVANTIIAISLVFIPPIARVAEAATRQVVVQEYIEAARLSGASPAQVVVYQLLPNIFSPVFVYVSGLVGLSIIIAAGLSFLGLGAAPPTPEWGLMLNNLRGSIYVQPWIAVLPGLCIFITSVACNVLSDSLRDALDVKGGLS